MIKEKLDRIKKGELTAVQNIKNFLDVIEKDDNKIKAFLHINKNAVKEAEEVDKKIKAGKAGRLAGLAVSVKSCISVTDMPISCASKTLENYYGTFNADVIERIRAEDAIIIGMTNMDEFASGSTGENSAFGATDNPAAPGFVPGGSSSGPAASVAAGMCDIALGTDTGGSIRCPASHCGVVGVKPSYGRVSRYGLLDLAMSFDQIGPLSNDVYGSALMMEVIAGRSKKDASSKDTAVQKYANFRKTKLKIGISDDFKKLCTDKRIYELIEKKITEFAEKTGSEIKKLNLKYVDLAIQTYYPIVYVEFFSATRKLDGRRYGKKIEDACGEEVLRRILGGLEISRAEHEGKYYRKALQVKKLIARDFESAFKGVDIMMLPTTPILPHKIGTKIEDPRTIYAYDAFTIPANLAGICGGVVPAGKIDSIPVGLQIFAPAFREDVMFNAMKQCEELEKLK